MGTVARIIELLSENGMDQKKFAQIIGVVPQTITDWKNGKSKSYTKYIPQIAEALGTTTEYLLTGSGEKNRPATTPEGSGQSVEFANLFAQLTPENQNQIIAEMLKRQREQGSPADQPPKAR